MTPVIDNVNIDWSWLWMTWFWTKLNNTKTSLKGTSFLILELW